MAALAVAIMIAMATTNTRSEREIASVDFWIMVEANSFRLFGFASSIWLGLFRFLQLPCQFPARPQAATSITLFRFGYVLQKFRMVPNPGPRLCHAKFRIVK